jgi:hypothetical protein
MDLPEHFGSWKGAHNLGCIAVVHDLSQNHT